MPSSTNVCPDEVPGSVLLRTKHKQVDELPNWDSSTDVMHSEALAMGRSDADYYCHVHTLARAWVDMKLDKRRAAHHQGDDSESDGRGLSPARCLRNNTLETKDLQDIVDWAHCVCFIGDWDCFFSETMVRLAEPYSRNYVGITRDLRRRVKGSRQKRMTGHMYTLDEIYILFFSAVGIGGAEMAAIKKVWANPSLASRNENKDPGGKGFSSDRAGLLHLAVA